MLFIKNPNTSTRQDEMKDMQGFGKSRGQRTERRVYESAVSATAPITGAMRMSFRCAISRCHSTPRNARYRAPRVMNQGRIIFRKMRDISSGPT
jgi:hypothetical protein